MGPFKKKAWSPYVAGGIVGLVLCLSVLVAGKYLGASTTFVRSAGLVERAVIPEHVAKNEYYQAKKVRVDWQFMLVVGVFFGALISSTLSGDFEARAVPRMWEESFGPQKAKRWLVAFLGGVVAMFGARLAGG